MEAQQIYDTVLYGLRAQGKASLMAAGTEACAYRSEDGCRCAAGLLIPDDVYDPAMEGRNARSVICKFKLADLAGFLDLIEDLQFAHDGALTDKGLVAWELQMEKLSHKHNLTYTPVSAATLPTVDTFGGAQ